MGVGSLDKVDVLLVLNDFFGWWLDWSVNGLEGIVFGVAVGWIIGLMGCCIGVELLWVFVFGSL